MFLRIQTLQGKKLIGKKIRMSFIDNKTRELWQSFMPRRKEIKNQLGEELYSLEVYDSSFFDNFNPSNEFDKWAGIEVTDFNAIPDEMEMIILPTGLYAVFLHKGPASQGERTYRYIFETWLPDSDYNLNHRPHFAVMGEKYKREDPCSEEEIWIPIKHKYLSSL